MKVGADKASNITKAVDGVLNAAKNGAKIVVLPVCNIISSSPKAQCRNASTRLMELGILPITRKKSQVDRLLTLYQQLPKKHKCTW